MPAPTPLPIRQAMHRRLGQGATPSELSRAFGVPPSTVRDLVRRWRAGGGAGPDYVRRPAPPPPDLGRAEEVRRERSKFWDPGVLRRRTIDLACAPTSKEAQLLHRYEVAHEKSLRAAIRGLLALEKSGADLPEPVEPAAPAAASASAGPDAPEKQDTTSEIQSSCVELASVGAAAPSGDRRERPSGTPGRPGRPIGADPRPVKGPDRR